MPVPTSYEDEDALAAYMVSVLDAIAADLGINATPSTSGDLGNMTEPVVDVLIAYGETDITRITGIDNIAKLRAIARVHALKIARRRASVLYNFADGSQRLDLGQIYEHIARELSEAESELGSMGVGPGAPVVRIGSITWKQDPYGPFNPIASGDE